jgi:hypothetical protein
MRNLLAGLLLLCLGAAGGVGYLWLKLEPDRTQRLRLEALLRVREEENERLRSIIAETERAQALEKNKTQREAIEKQVTEIRGLSFTHPVDYALLTRKEIKAVVASKLADTFTAQEFIHISDAFARLGLLPENYPLREKYIDLLGEQIAAFYDQHQHKLFMFEDATLDNAQNCVVLAHELTHALQDQHFDLLKMPLEIKNNDDRAEASSALVEGEATIVMSEYMLKNMSLRALKDNLATTFGQNMDQLQKAPRFLRESLVFPYLRGQEFCSALIDRGGYEAISKAFANPPRSTSQILHPEKYLAQPREDPIAIPWTDFAIAGQNPSQDNVLGELGIRILLSENGDAPAADRAAAGWRGDRYLSYGKGESLVWKTVWNTEQDATEFYDAERLCLEKRYHLKNAHAENGGYQCDSPRAIRLTHQKDHSILLIDAPSLDLANQLLDHFSRE